MFSRPSRFLRPISTSFIFLPKSPTGYLKTLLNNPNHFQLHQGLGGYCTLFRKHNVFIYTQWYGCWRVERLPPIVGGFDPTEAFGLRMKDRLQWRKQV